MKIQLPLLITIAFSYCLLACAGNDGPKNNNATAGIDEATARSASGSGYYYEMTTSTHSNRMSINMLLKLFLSPGGDVRTEMSTSGISGKKDNGPIVLIGAASNTIESTIIDDAAKTYTVNHIDPADMVFDKQITSAAVKIGEEKIGDYNCVHARIISTRNMGPLGKLVDTIDSWKSNEVALPAVFKKWMEAFETKTGGAMYSPEAVKQLEQMGCTGFPVKLTLHSKSASMVMQLTKTERKDFPKSLFEIPPGYKESKSGQ